jgi:uncharacterized damage-inducible protein DinB
MYLQNLTTRLLKYNLWANERLTSWLATLEPKVMYQHTGSSFGTIDRTIQHILSAEIYWYEVISHQQINEFNGPVRDNVIDEVIADLISGSKRLVDAFSKFKEEQLLEIIRAADSSQSRFEYIIHLVNHGSYHRGQVVTMCRALSITGEIPVTDYDAYLWWIENMC